jgi:hypothetical protein
MQAEHAEATTAVKDGVCVYVRTARWASGGAVAEQAGRSGRRRPVATRSCVAEGRWLPGEWSEHLLIRARRGTALSQGEA